MPARFGNTKVNLMELALLWNMRSIQAGSETAANQAKAVVDHQQKSRVLGMV
jgi:hypothetical protein